MPTHTTIAMPNSVSVESAVSVIAGAVLVMCFVTFLIVVVLLRFYESKSTQRYYLVD